MRKIKQASLLHLMSSSFPRKAEPHKKDIVSYMRSKKARWHTGSNVTDLVTGRQTNEPLEACEDDGWGWDTTELLMFERYDLELDPDFVKHVLKKIGLNEGHVCDPDSTTHRTGCSTETRRRNGSG